MRRLFEFCLWALVLTLAVQVPGEAMAAQAGPALTRDFLIGRWTDTGNCSDAVDFNADGSFVTTGRVRGRWTLEGNQLSFIGQQTIRTRVTATSNSSLTVTHEDGSVGNSTRCGAPRRLAMPPLPASAEAALRMGGPINRSFLLGSWTDSGDCAAAIVFHDDGRFVVPTGTGRWSLDGDRLTFTAQSTLHARVRGVGRDRIILIHPDGSVGQSLRC